MIKAAKVIPISPRTEGMVDASAEYYQESRIFHAIQNTQALEYDRIDESNIDLALQLSPLTATWGLVYWEIAVSLIPRPLDDYERRRPPILARLINEENFSAEMVYKIAECFGATISVNIDSAACLITVTFTQVTSSRLDDFDKILQNVIHAHLGIDYKIVYTSEGGIRYSAHSAVTNSIIIHPLLDTSYTATSTLTLSANENMSATIMTHAFKDKEQVLT